MPQQGRVTNYDLSQIFLGRNRFKDYTYTNSTGSTVTINPGRLMGQILATGLLLPQVAAATDGSEFPMSVAADTYVVLDGASVTMTVCEYGEVNQSKLIFNSAETLSTVIRTVSTGGKTIGQALIANTGIELIPVTELSLTDPNQ